MAVTEFTAAISGSGKTYRRCAHFLATEFLPLKTGRIWCNFPIHIEAMVAYVCEHHPHLVPLEIKDRIKIIPEDELKRWRDGTSGPWRYFEGEQLEGDRIAIDEIHNYVSSSTPKEIVKKWQEFLGEIRHRGCEFEALSQYDTKVHVAIRHEAGLKRDLFNCEQRRDPFCSILMADWYNLRAKFITGRYSAAVFEYEWLPLNGKWRLHHTLKFTFEPEFFALYDSYSTPIAGGTKARSPQHPYQQKTKAQLVYWFLLRNWFQLFSRVFIIVLAAWICFFGGGRYLLRKFMDIQLVCIDANSSKPAGSGTSSATAAAAAPGAAPVQGVSATAAAAVPPSAAVESLKKQVEELQKDKADLEKKLTNSGQILLLSDTFIVLRNGTRVDVGDPMPEGFYDAKILVSIDMRKRCVLLSDNSVHFAFH